MLLPSRYWSCSALAHRLWRMVGHPKPVSATLEEWGAWRRIARTQHPQVYWLTEGALDAVRKTLFAPWAWLEALRLTWIRRVVRKTHCLPTGLPAGQWHDPDEQILHVLFTLLVNFVEIDKATKQRWCAGRQSWWARIRGRRWGVYRSREDGLSHLEWETTLDDPSLPEYEASPEQAASAREVLALYYWWTEQRPARPDPYDYAGYRDDDAWSLDEMLERVDTEEARQAQRARLARLAAIQAQYDQEDDLMLTRLISVRRSLWT